MRRVLQYLEWVAQAARASLMRNFHCLSCCRQIWSLALLRCIPLAFSPRCLWVWRQISRAARASPPQMSLLIKRSSQAFFSALRIALFCDWLQLRVSRLLRQTLSLSLSFFSALTFFPCAVITMCAFYRLCALSLYLFFLSPSPCLSSVSFLVSCFVKEIAFVLFYWRPEFSAESVSLQASSWWWTATNIAPCDWEFTPGPEERDHLALFPNWCSKPCCLVFCQCLILAEGQRSPLADHKGRSEHHTLPVTWRSAICETHAGLSFGALVETCDRVGVRAIAHFNNESNLHLVIS